jgi:hypothetical protein
MPSLGNSTAISLQFLNTMSKSAVGTSVASALQEEVAKFCLSERQFFPILAVPLLKELAQRCFEDRWWLSVIPIGCFHLGGKDFWNSNPQPTSIPNFAVVRQTDDARAQLRSGTTQNSSAEQKMLQ